MTGERRRGASAPDTCPSIPAPSRHADSKWWAGREEAQQHSLSPSGKGRLGACQTAIVRGWPKTQTVVVLVAVGGSAAARGEVGAAILGEAMGEAAVAWREAGTGEG